MNQSETNISPHQIYIWCDQISEENQKLRERIEYLQGHCIVADKFYNSALGVEVVAAMHGVNPATVRKYVKTGAIPKHPNSTDGKILIRGSVALLLDFDELRRGYSVRHAK